MVAASLGFVALAAAALGITASAFRLLERSGERFLWSFTLYLGLWNGFALVLVAQYILAPQVLPGEFIPQIAVVNAPLNLGLMATSVYFLLASCAHMVGRPLPRSLAVAYGAGWVAVLVVASVAIDPRAAGFPGSLSAVAGIAKNLVVLGAVAVLVVGARHLGDASRRRRVLVFAATFSGGYVAYLAALTLLKGGVAGGWLIACAQVLFNVPALAVLAGGLERDLARPPAGAEGEALGPYLEEKGLSKREREVVGLLLEGANNKQIQVALDISLETVKKHVYNTYRKLGVRSRLQLVVLLRDRIHGR